MKVHCCYSTSVGQAWESFVCLEGSSLHACQRLTKANMHKKETPSFNPHKGVSLEVGAMLRGFWAAGGLAAVPARWPAGSEVFASRGFKGAMAGPKPIEVDELLISCSRREDWSFGTDCFDRAGAGGPPASTPAAMTIYVCVLTLSASA